MQICPKIRPLQIRPLLPGFNYRIMPKGTERNGLFIASTPKNAGTLIVQSSGSSWTKRYHSSRRMTTLLSRIINVTWEQCNCLLIRVCASALYFNLAFNNF